MKHVSDYKIFKSQQDGNVLWFILLGVALLSFLTIVITRSGSSVEQSGSVEHNRIIAGALLRYAGSVEVAVTQMMSRGVSESDLDFVAMGAANDNPNCIDPSCEVFHVEGGGIHYKTPAEILGDSSFTGSWTVSGGNRVYHIGCDDNTAECSELLFLLPDIPKAICLQVNSIEGIQNPSGDAPRQFEVYQGGGFNGTFSSLSSYFGGTDATNESPQVAGKPAGCVFEFGGGQNRYYFYKTLIAR